MHFLRLQTPVGADDRRPGPLGRSFKTSCASKRLQSILIERTVQETCPKSLSQSMLNFISFYSIYLKYLHFIIYEYQLM
jgi:hypothetical protein